MRCGYHFRSPRSGTEISTSSGLGTGLTYGGSLRAGSTPSAARQLHMAARFSQQEILTKLDDAARDFKFPGLDNGFIYPVDTRLHAFRDDARWALVIEVVGYD